MVWRKGAGQTAACLCDFTEFALSKVSGPENGHGRKTALPGFGAEHQQLASTNDSDNAKHGWQRDVVRFFLFSLNRAHVYHFFVGCVGNAAINQRSLQEQSEVCQ